MSQTHFYLKWLQIKKKFYGLTPLEQYIALNHDDANGYNPLSTYFYFLAYEKEVLAYARQFRNALLNNRVTAYNNTLKAVRDHSLENTTYKATIHVVSLFMVGILMLCASAVSTYKIMDFFGEAFGAYGPLMQGFFFVTATYTQWLIFGITAPDTMKKLFYGNPFGKTWHFNQLRELEIGHDGKLKNTIETQPTYSALKLGFFVFCSVVLALSLGMILLNTADTSAAEGNVFKEMGMLHQVVSALGGLHVFSRFLFVVYFFCNFALFVSGSMNYLLKEAREKDTDLVAYTHRAFLGVRWTKTLVGLVSLNMIGLIGTILSQMMSTFNFVSGFNGTPGYLALDEAGGPPGWVKYALLPVMTMIAVLGRVIFNIKAMENVDNLMKEVWCTRETIWSGFKNDIRNNAWSYGIAIAGVVISTITFGLMGGFGGDTGIQAMRASKELSSLAPLVLVMGFSLTTWAAYKTVSRYQRVKAGSEEDSSRLNCGLNATESTVKPTFTLKPDARPLSGAALFAIAGNSMGAAGIAQSSTCVFDVYAPESQGLKTGTSYPLMLGGGVMSTGSPLRNTTAQKSRPSYATYRQ